VSHKLEVGERRSLASHYTLTTIYIYYEIVHEIHKSYEAQQDLRLLREMSNHSVQKSTPAHLWVQLQCKDLIYKKNSDVQKPSLLLQIQCT